MTVDSYFPIPKIGENIETHTNRRKYKSIECYICIYLHEYYANLHDVEERMHDRLE